MAKILNVDAIHNKGEAEVVVGIRGNQFKLSRAPGSNKVTLLDPVTNKALILDSLPDPSTRSEPKIDETDVTAALGYTPVSQEDMENYVTQAILGGAW